MRPATVQHLKRYAFRSYHLDSYLQCPGDGRLQPQIPCPSMTWALIAGQLLRECTFHAIEALVRSPARSKLGVSRRFGDDALGYFTERLDPNPTRRTLAGILKRAKRNKAFDRMCFIGLAVDGSKASHTDAAGCRLCHPIYGAEHRLLGHRHQFSMISIVGAGLSLPFDIEPYGPGDSEYLASQRLLRRAMESLGPRYAFYVVADGEYATAPWLHLAGDLGLHVVSRLKANLPELFAAAQTRFSQTPPSMTFEIQGDFVELWDADDFDPWDTLRWSTVRVVRYRQHKPDGTVNDAYWVTDLSAQHVGSRSIYRMAKSRWEIENQGFNEAKTYHGMEHITHHHPNSLLIGWLLALLALCLERLYRLRYLHRGTHPVLSSIDLLRKLQLSLCPPRLPDTS